MGKSAASACLFRVSQYPKLVLGSRSHFWVVDSGTFQIATRLAISEQQSREGRRYDVEEYSKAPAR